MLLFWVCRGRPALDITNFYQRTSTSTLPNADGAPAVLGVVDGRHTNAWLAIFQSAIFHPNEHLPKIVRTLGHFAIMFGSIGKDTSSFDETELEGTDVLDGTLFLRVAILTMQRLGWLKEGTTVAVGDFDFDGLWPRV